MADTGTFKHWIDGQPDGTVEVTANKSGSFKYWIDGQPWGTEYPAAGSNPTGNSNFFIFFDGAFMFFLAVGVTFLWW